MTEAPQPTADFRLVRAERVCLATGVVLLSAVLLFGFIRPEWSFRSYLVAYLAWLAVPLGSLALTTLHHLTGGSWGAALRPAWEPAIATLPLFALALIPVLLGLSHLYPWARSAEVAGDEVLRGKRLYLNVPFFLVRAALCWLAWITLALLIQRQPRHSSTENVPGPRRFRLLSAVGLIVLGVTITFAAIDWSMSLEPEWFSSIYGLLFASGQLLSALSFAILMLGLLPKLGLKSPNMPPQLLRDLGNLLLTFTMLWAYMAFSQLLVIWSGNLPEELPWYVRRLANGWEWAALTVVIFQFVLPFMLLLSPAIKHNSRSLAAIAGVIFLARLVDTWWMVAPAFPTEYSLERALDIVAIAALGGLWLGVFLRKLRLGFAVASLETAAGEEVRHE